MQFEDTMSIATPEGVSLEVRLAGLGSRAGAAVIDGVIQSALLILLALIFGSLLGNIDLSEPTGSDAELTLIVIAVLNVVQFVIVFFYSVIFESLWSGRTPGKRAFGTRVVQLSGARVGFKASMVRNLLRLVDFLPSFYLVGILTVLASSRNQRVGDLVAGTVVIVDRTPATSGQTWAAPPAPGHYTPSQPLPEVAVRWDVSAITGDELTAAKAFLSRRHSIPPQVRANLAAELSGKLREKVAGAQDWNGADETFLELLVTAKTARS
jgi:uncharacterized RDD family membrane protein YckC